MAKCGCALYGDNDKNHLLDDLLTAVDNACVEHVKELAPKVEVNNKGTLDGFLPSYAGKSNGSTALQLACVVPQSVCSVLRFAEVMKSKIEIIDILLSAGADIDLISDEDDILDTPLMIAATYNSMDIVECLIGKGADLMIENEQYTALLYAAERGNIEIFSYLKLKGDYSKCFASNRIIEKYNEQIRPEFGTLDTLFSKGKIELALSYAQQESVSISYYSSSLKKLFKECCDIDQLLWDAVSNNAGIEEIESLLRDDAANPNVTKYYNDEEGYRLQEPLFAHTVIEVKSVEIAQLLLRYGADPNQCCDICIAQDPLKVLIKNNNIEMLEFLIKDSGLEIIEMSSQDNLVEFLIKSRNQKMIDLLAEKHGIYLNEQQQQLLAQNLNIVAESRKRKVDGDKIDDEEGDVSSPKEKKRKKQDDADLDTIIMGGRDDTCEELHIMGEGKGDGGGEEGNG